MTETSGLATTGRWLFAATLSAAALAAGTVHTVTLCVVTAGLALAMGLTWWGADRADSRPRFAATLLVVTAAGLTVYTGLQTIPIPMGWLGAIAPRNADVWSRALSPLHETGPRWAPLSLDPVATRREVLKGVAYLLAFLTALRIARKRDGIAFLSTAIVVIGAVVAAAALLHPAFGAHRLYGIWAPSTQVLVYDRHVAPFLNPNNLAAYLNVAFCLALAATLSPEPRWPRPIVAAATVLLGATQIWVASRGGVASMVLGAGLVIVIARGHRLSHPQRGRMAKFSVVGAVALVAGVCMVVLAGSKQSSDELFETSVSKIELLRQVVRMIPAYPIFGTGRGAFESTFPLFRTSPGPWTFTHPENVIAQWTIEWGLPLGLSGLAAIAFALRPNTVLARSSTAAGAWAGLCAVAVQNLVDLGSETPGLVLAPVVCAAIVVGGTAGGRARRPIEKWGQSPRILTLIAGFVALAAIGLTFPGIGEELRDDRATLHDAAVVEHTPLDRIRALARGAMLRHPAEPYLPFIIGWRAAAERDDDPMGWIEATLERSRLSAPAHLILARLFAKRSPAQARLEYRLAMEQGLGTDGPWASDLPTLVHCYDDAAELVSAGQSGLAVMKNLRDPLALRLPATVARLDADIVRRAPSDPEPWARTAMDYITDLETGESSPWCDGSERAACVARAIDATAKAEQLAPATCEPLILRARIRVAALDAPNGLSELANAANTVPEPAGCLKALVELADRTHDEARATAAITKLAALGCTDDAECSANLAWVAAAQERRGNGRQALALYKRASDRSPGRDDLLEAAARLAASTGLHADAQQDYERLAHRHPEQTKWQNAADTEHEASLRAATYR